MSKHDKNGPTVEELREGFRWSGMVKLGRLALWNCLTKKVVDLRAPTVGLIKTFDPDMFEELVNSPRPVFIRDAQS